MSQSNGSSPVKTGTTRTRKSKRSRRAFTADYKLAVLAHYNHQVILDVHSRHAVG